VSEASSVVL